MSISDNKAMYLSNTSTTVLRLIGKNSYLEEPEWSEKFEDIHQGE